MKHRCGQQNGGAALPDRIGKILQFPGPAGGHHRCLDRIRDRFGKLQVISRPGAVAVHAGRQDHSRAGFFALFCPFHRVFSHGFCASRNHQLESGRQCAVPARINGHGDPFRTKPLCGLPDQRRTLDRRTVHGDPVRPGGKQQLHIRRPGYAAADGQGHFDDPGDVFDPFEPRLAVFEGGGNIEHRQLIGAFPLIESGIFHGVAGIPQPGKVNSLDHTAILHVEAWHDLNGCHHFLLVLFTDRVHTDRSL